MTLDKKIRVGLVGCNPQRGWALTAHVPALRALPDYEITVLCNSRQESADEAARQLGVPHAFSDPHAMARHPEVDLVVVTVKVPEHDRLVRAGLEAGKHVYCEWPLAMDSREGEALVQLAEAQGVRHIVGLQSRASPLLRYVHDLVKHGHIGRVRSSSVIASGMVWGPYIDKPNAYSLDARHRVTMETVPFGHFADVFTHCLGEFAELAAFQDRFFSEAMLVDTGEMLPKTASDQFLLQGRLDSGVMASLHYRGGTSRGANFYWEINGTEGDLVITSDMGHAQFGDLRLRGGRGQEQALSDMEVPASYIRPDIPRGPGWNVGHLYAALAPLLRDAAATGPAWLPDFHTANRVHHLIERAEASAAARQPLA